ncbi:MAG TPA: hypothetical protein VFP56_01660 [Candidatus Limnocylindrales bacterium]|nr:hypothetical protein [Candidatus Limnocylindrales bacterium]
MSPAPLSPESAADNIRIATIHLRLGQLTLARAELEDLLGRDALDSLGLAALAEARWRTGDSDAATSAAEAHLETGGTDPVAICIAAEAAAAEGRPGDARVLMDRLPAADAAALDALFAGMPRRAFWPAGAVDRTDIDDLRREQRTFWDAPQVQGHADASGGEARATAEPGSETPGVASRAVPGPREVLEASGAWASIAAQMTVGESATRQLAGPRRQKAELDPRAELERARDELGAKPERALLRMALALRADPTIAPAVLDAINLRREPAAALLRGDAQRLLGRHLEAEAAFDAAAETLES